MNRKDYLISELKFYPLDPFNQYLLALEFIKENNRSEANKIFNTIYVASPQYLPLYYTYATNLIELENLKQAKVVIEEGIKLATINEKEKVKNELYQLLELFF